MKFKKEDIDKLNEKLKIEEVVGRFVQLKKSGSTYKGLCPFHPDSSPSFMVSPGKNICKCFVCGAGGNPVNFYSKFKNIPFDQAISELADFYKIPIKAIETDPEEDEEKRLQYEIMEAAHDFYKEEIFKNSGRIALDYLLDRGVTPEVITGAGIGYAPNARQSLTEYLLGKGYTLENLIKLGLTKENEKGVYDSFRERVIFPIFSLGKRVTAFGGRSLSSNKDIPKYINSSDTPIFKKGSILYGLGEKSELIRQKKYAILMEGYMDVIMATLNGFDVTLAPLGTALTEEQGKLLKRYTHNVILAFDSDTAGMKATEKAVILLKKIGFSVRIIKLTGAKDPDEFIRKFGKSKFLDVIKNSMESFDFLYNYYALDYSLNNVMSKNNFINRFKEFFQNVENSVEKSLYIDKFSANIGVPKEVLWEELVAKNKEVPRKKEINLENNFDETKAVEKENELEKLSLSLLITDSSLYEFFYDKPIESLLGKKILQNFSEVIHGKNKIDIKELLKGDKYSEEEKNRIFQYSLLKFDLFPNESQKKEVLIQVLKDWTRAELNSLKKNTRDIIKVLELKKIENELNNINDENKYFEIHKKILEIKNEF